MIKVLFICHGNICRSPMAEFMLRDRAEKAGVAGRLVVASAAVSSEEIIHGVGNSVYPPARAELARHGIDCGNKRARLLRREDYENYDLLIGMDRSNLRGMLHLFGGDPQGKLRTMLSFAGRESEEVADPWYTGDFRRTWEDLAAGCDGIMRELFGVS